MGFFGRKQKGGGASHEISDPLILEMGRATEQVMRNMFEDARASSNRTRQWVAEQRQKDERLRAEQREGSQRWAAAHRDWEETFLAEQRAINARRRRETKR